MGLFRYAFICCLLLALRSAPAIAQQSSATRPRNGWLGYGTFAAGGALKGESYGCSATLISPSGWGGSLAYRSNRYQSRYLPEDYEEGFCLHLFEGDCMPKDQVSIVSLLVLKTFPLVRTKLVRFSAEAGPAIVNYTEASFAPDTSPHGIFYFGGNYITSYTTRSTLGFTARASAAFPLSRGCGFEASLWGNGNRYHSLLGIEGCFTAGLVRDRVKRRG